MLGENMDNGQVSMFSNAKMAQKDEYRESIHLFECLTYIKDE